MKLLRQIENITQNVTSTGICHRLSKLKKKIYAEEQNVLMTQNRIFPMNVLYKLHLLQFHRSLEH